MIAPEWNAIVCHDGGPFYINTYLEKAYVDHFSGTFSRVNNGKPREFTEYILPGDMDKNFRNTKVDREYNDYVRRSPILNLLRRKSRLRWKNRQAILTAL